jgi:exopolysaccharide production protein ExoZ
MARDADQTGRRAPGTPRDLFRSIQYLRAVAAMMVLLYHLGLANSFLGDQPPRPHWLAAGVDIFFLISGFVMVLSTEQRSPTGARFFGERVARVVPLYWLVTAIFVGVMALQQRELPSIVEVAKSLLFIFYTNPRTHEPTPILTLGWTLNYEMIFYLLFALLIRLSVTKRIGTMAALFLCLCAFRPLVPHDNALLFRLTSPQPLEFVAGMALAHWRRTLIRLNPAVGLAAIAAGFAGLALVDSDFTRVVHFAPCATLIVAGAIVCERAVRGNLRPLRLLGDASYSLYLTHPLVLAAMEGVPVKAAHPFAWAGATMLTSVAVALAFYRWFEVPSLRFFRGLLGRAPASRQADRADVPS